MRVAAVDELASLTPSQRGIVERLGQWPNDEERELLRVYRLDDGDVMVAPWNPEIQPGMEIIAEGFAGVAFVDAVRTGDSTSVHYAAALAER